MSDSKNHIDEIIKRLGGPTTVARYLKCAQSSVSEWVVRGIIPSRRIPELIRFGLSLKPQVKLKHDAFFPKETKTPTAA